MLEKFTLLTAACATLCAACADEPTMVAAAAPRRALAPYQGHATLLLDDGIDPSAVGLAIQPGPEPKGDPVLRARTQASDAVVRVRITTVTRTRHESGASYLLGFRIVDRVAGTKPPLDDFVVELGPRSPAIGVVRGFEDRLVAMNLTFVAFVRGFAPADGAERAVHFHLSPDTKDVVDAVAAIAAIEELK